MQSKARTVEEYLAELPEDRQQAISSLRQVILENLPDGYEEGMQYGMIGYYVPLKDYPETYNGQALSYAALASQKNHMAVYLMNIYSDQETIEWFEKAYRDSGKKLDMGKSCVRFKRIDDLPLDLIGEAIARTPVKKYIEIYEASRKR